MAHRWLTLSILLFPALLLTAGCAVAQQAEPQRREAEHQRREAEPQRREAEPQAQLVEPQRRPVARRPRGEDVNSAYMGGGMVQQAPFSPPPAARPAVELAPMPNSNLEAPRQQRTEAARLTAGVIAPRIPGRGSAQDGVSPGSLQDRLFRPAAGAHLRIPMSW